MGAAFSMASNAAGNTNTNTMVGNGSTVNTTTINYYADAYASASSPNQLVQDPDKFTKPLVDAIGTKEIALKSPNVEECGYADRVVQLTQGNSTITVQEAANIVCGYGEWPRYLDKSEASVIDVPTQPDTAVNRFYTLESVNWSKTSRGWGWRFPGIMKDVGLFGQNMQYHYLMRTGFLLHVQCNASKFHQGCLLVVCIPEFEFLSTNITGADDSFDLDQEAMNELKKDYPLCQLTLFPHQFINLRTNNAASIIMPYMNAVPMDNGLVHNNFCLLVIPIVPLDYSTGATTAVPITITASPCCAEYNGLRFALLQGLPVQLTPGSSQFLTTNRAASAPVIPSFEQISDNYHIPGEVHNLLEIAKVDTLLSFSANEIYHTLNGSVNSNTQMFRFELNLAHSNGQSTLGETYIARLMQYYAHVSGSVRLTFVFCGSAMTTGKIIICYTPPGGTGPTNRAAAMLGTHVIWDIGLQSSCSICIPWISASAYRFTAGPGTQSNELYSTYGILTAFTQTKAVFPPNVPQNGRILCFISACDDFTLRLPMDRAITQGIKQDVLDTASQIMKNTAERTSPVPASSNDVQVGSSAALSAVETGSTNPAQPQDMMETRAVSVTKSTLETTVENFFSRSSYITRLIIPSMSEFVTWTLTLKSDDAPLIRRKVQMFTYMRFDTEVTLVITNNAEKAVRYQIMYIPPGAVIPTSSSASEWQTTTNPSVFVSSTDAPPSFSIPFLSIAHAYSMFYDGYSNFSTLNGVYGTFPPNHMGTMAVRVLTPVPSDLNTEIRVYIKPKHVRCWVPRPISKYEFTSLGKTKYSKDLTGVNIGKFKIVNLHMATQEEKDSAHYTYQERDLIITDRGTGPSGKIARCDCTNGMYYSSFNKCINFVEFGSPRFVHFKESQWYGAHYQSHVLVGNGCAMAGDCGNVLYCHHGIIGLLTGGDMNGQVAFADIRDLWNLLDQEPMQQGVTDYITSLGSAFGEGFTDAIKAEINTIKEQATGLLPGIEEMLKMTVQVVSALTICVRHYDDTMTVMATLALIGCSNTSPFRWLKNKFMQLIGVPTAEKQGDSWIKKFTEFVNAFKGLDWIAEKISKFIDWLKTKLIPQAKEKKLFLDRLRQLPLLANQIDSLSVKGTHCSRTQLSALMANTNYYKVHLLKYAPLYAAELRTVSQLESKLNRHLRLIGKERFEPICVVIHGSPGTGKSIATQLIGRSLAEKFNSDVYSLPPDPKYFDGYNQQAVVVMDDLCQNPDGEDMKLFCQMVSSVEFLPPMASLEEKGISFNSPFVLASTNLPNFNPPTISDMDAVKRRFFLDLDIEITTEYTKERKLDLNYASDPCGSCEKPANFKQCCPLVCGRALILKDRKTNVRMSVDSVVSSMLRCYTYRNSTQNKLAALFQNEFHDLRIDVVEKPPPPCIQDLLNSVDSEEVREYCTKQGWIVQVQPTAMRLDRHYNGIVTILSSLLAAISVLGTLLIIYRLFAGLQGPYTGMPKPPKTPPTLRTAQVQGPNLDFAVSLIRRNLVSVTTTTGTYTGLGVCERLLVLPTHAKPGDEVLLGNTVVRVKDGWSLVDKHNTNLEITVIELDRNEKFRDIRSFIPDEIEEHDECCLIMNTPRFQNLCIPIGQVAEQGFLSLSGHATQRLLRYDYPTVSGQCGGVVCKTGKVIGIHVGGNGAQGFCAALLRRYFPIKQGEITKVVKMEQTINVPSKTKLYPSVWHDVFPGKKEPAVLHPKDKRCQVDFEEALFSKYKGNIDVKIDDEMKEAIDHYAGQLHTLDIDVKPLSMEQAVFGVEGLEPLDLHTSAGYPYVTKGIKKKDLINNTTKDISKLKQCIAEYGLELPYTTYIKDELRSQEKVKAGKSRVIEASSVNDSVTMRMAFGNMYAKFHQNPGIVTGSAVGCNPDVFWSQIPCLMNEHLLAFDYTNYDASLSPVWFECLKEVLRKLGYDEKAVAMINYLCHSVHLYKDKKYYVSGGMPSGCSGTSIFNTMINNLILRTLVLKAYKGINLDDLRIIAYGDDIIASYPFPLDASSLAAEGKKLGLTMTPADKGETFQQVTWENVTFLKRFFRADDKFSFLVHPVMPMSEIYESIRYTRGPKTTQEHVTSLCYLAWHSGEEKYNEFLEKIRSVPVGKALSLPPYVCLRRMWYEMF